MTLPQSIAARVAQQRFPLIASRSRIQSEGGVDSKLVHLVNQAADVVAEDHQERFVDLRRAGLAAEPVTRGANRPQ